MAQLRQEDSATIVSMLSRRCTDNRSTSTLADEAANNTSTTSESTGSQSQLMAEEASRESGSEVAVVPRCPVCGKSLLLVGRDETLLSRHVDECLNQAAVNDLLASEKQTSAVNSKCR